LKGLDIAIVTDILEVGAFAALGLATKSSVVLRAVGADQLDPLLIKFDQMGAEVEVKGDDLIVSPTETLKAFNIKTNVWPGFPTDLQAPFSALATQCHGQSMIHDWMYEGRLFYFDKLHTMGASIIMCDPHRVIINGPTQLHGKEIESPDIRAGMAMVIAALCAEGTSTIYHAELIERGYQDVDQRLQAVGARIERIEE
jgi:UDP-N-acetylglucosamine 1-carboxyvinyltransferase